MDDWGVSAQAAELHKDALVWDNTIIGNFPGGMAVPRDGRAETPQSRFLQRFVAAGVNYVSWTVASDKYNVETVEDVIAGIYWWLSHNSDRAVLARKAADIEAAKREGKLAIGFNFQGAAPIHRNLDLIGFYNGLGVRQMLLAYNHQNMTGGGCHDPDDSGLTRFGRLVIEEMNRVGMLLDLTHCGYRTARDALDVSGAPVVFSHSNARGLCDHERNIPDDLIDACAAGGGVIGLNGIGIFLGDNRNDPEAMIRHIDYIVERVGPDHVGIGLDHVSDPARFDDMLSIRKSFDFTAGQGYELGGDIVFMGPQVLPRLTEGLLKRGYDEAHICAILGGNFLRVAKQVWG